MICVSLWFSFFVLGIFYSLLDYVRISFMSPVASMSEQKMYIYLTNFFSLFFTFLILTLLNDLFILFISPYYYNFFFSFSSYPTLTYLFLLFSFSISQPKITNYFCPWFYILFDLFSNTLLILFTDHFLLYLNKYFYYKRMYG